MTLNAAELDPVFSTLASYFSVLAEPSRLKIMQAVCESERCVGAIVAATGISQPNVSRHLALMHQRGVVWRRRKGNQVFYRLADQTMPEVCRAVCARIATGMDERRLLRRKLLRLIPPPKKRAA